MTEIKNIQMVSYPKEKQIDFEIDNKHGLCSMSFHCLGVCNQCKKIKSIKNSL